MNYYKNSSPFKRRYLPTFSRFVLVLVLFLLAFGTSIFGIKSDWYPNHFKSQLVQAAPADTLNFQGRLLELNGGLVDDGFYNIEFKLYDSASGGTALWTENYTTATNQVRIANGYFSVYLGDYSPFTPNIPWGQELYLTMNVNGDGEMNPRFRLTAVPYAFSAKEASQLVVRDSGFTTTVTLTTPTQDNAITIPNASGEVCLSSGNCSSTSLWTDAGDFTHLTSLTDAIVIGASTDQAAKLAVVGNTDQTQLLIKANSTQTTPLILAQNSGGSELFRLTNSGNSLFLGHQAGQNDDGTNNNTGIGYNSLQANTTGGGNTALGSSSLLSNTTGYQNTALGSSSLLSNTTGYQNTALGSYSLRYNTTGSNNLVQGYLAGYGSGASTNDSSNNVILGYRSGYLIDDADNNILLGYQAGDNITNGDNNIIIGYDLDASSATVNNELRIGGILQGDTSTLAAQFNGTLAVTDTATFNNNIRIQDSDNTNYATINSANLSADYTVSIPTITANDTFCLESLGNCGNTNPILQGGNSFGQAVTIGSNDSQNLVLETNNTVALTIDDSQNVALNQGLALSGSNSYLNFGAVLGATGYGIRDNAGTLQYKDSAGSWTNLSSSSGAWTSSGGNTYLNTLTDKVGIGTNTPSTALDISSSSPNIELDNTDADPYSRIVFQNQGANRVLLDYGTGTTDDFRILTAAGAAGSETYTQRFRITADGDVGIGTGIPGAKLNVVDYADITPDSDASGHIKITGSGYAGFIALDANAMWLGHNSGARALYLATNETARLVVAANGNVGIGTDTPGAKLTVKAESNSVDGILLDRDPNEPQASARLFFGSSTSGYAMLNYGGNLRFAVNPQIGVTSGTTVFSLMSNGGIAQDVTSANYDVWIQGSLAGTAPGDSRNLALLGNTNNDQLVLNYNSEYDCVGIGGNNCNNNEALSVRGGFSTTGDNKLGNGGAAFASIKKATHTWDPPNTANNSESVSRNWCLGNVVVLGVQAPGNGPNDQNAVYKYGSDYHGTNQWRANTTNACIVISFTNWTGSSQNPPAGTWTAWYIEP